MLNNKKYSTSFWYETLPVIDFPFPGESLLGYLLRLDDLNDFYPGTILKEALHSHKRVTVNCASDLEFIEENVDIAFLSTLLGISEDAIKSLTIAEIRRKIYNSYNNVPKELFNYSSFKICPKCLKDWKIPILFFFNAFDSCLIHGSKLISHCKCGERIDLFNKTHTLSCSNKSCKSSYIDLYETLDIDSTMVDRYQYFYFTYNLIISNSIPIVEYSDKDLKVLDDKLDFLYKIKKEAYECLKRAIPINIDGRVSYYEHDLARWSKNDGFYSIVSALYEFKLMPYQFVNLYVPYNIGFESKIIELNVIKKNQLKDDEHKRASYLYDKINNSTAKSRSVYKLNSFITSPILQGYFDNTAFSGKLEVKCMEISVWFEFLVNCSYENALDFRINELKICMTHF